LLALQGKIPLKGITSRSSLLAISFVVAFAGLFAASVLSAGHLLHLPVPCGKSSGCITVASDPSSKWFGVPFAFIGVAAYLLIIFLLTRAARERWARLGSSRYPGSVRSLAPGCLPMRMR
jgi:uncharacterized membrane protein